MDPAGEGDRTNFGPGLVPRQFVDRESGDVVEDPGRGGIMPDVVGGENENVGGETTSALRGVLIGSDTSGTLVPLRRNVAEACAGAIGGGRLSRRSPLPPASPAVSGK